MKTLLVRKKVILFAALGYTGFLATVSLIRIDNLPDAGISFADKIFHFLAYGLLTLLWFGVFSNNYRKKVALRYAAIFSVGFGIIIEVLQKVLTEYRALDGYDIVANTFGVLLMSGILSLKNKVQVKNS
ncbi:VanZ family protein [Tamlana fucoidanivorans]